MSEDRPRPECLKALGDIVGGELSGAIPFRYVPRERQKGATT